MTAEEEKHVQELTMFAYGLATLLVIIGVIVLIIKYY
jgi:hypothetical protein